MRIEPTLAEMSTPIETWCPCPELDASLFFDPDEIRGAHPLAKKKLPVTPPTVNDVVRLMLQIGGFLARKVMANRVPRPSWCGLDRYLLRLTSADCIKLWAAVGHQRSLAVYWRMSADERQCVRHSATSSSNKFGIHNKLGHRGNSGENEAVDASMDRSETSMVKQTIWLFKQVVQLRERLAYYEQAHRTGQQGDRCGTWHDFNSRDWTMS
jgi:hypothetical protein